MSFWLREIVGWALVLAGLLIFARCFDYLSEQRVFEAGPPSIIGIVLFRGGIHLLKVSIAARICREARDRTKADRPVQAPRPVRPAPRIASPVNRVS